MLICLEYSVAVLLLTLSLSSGQCTTVGLPNEYTLSPRPERDPIDNNDTFLPPLCTTRPMEHECLVLDPSLPPLVDGELGAVNSVVSSQIHAWSRSQTNTVTISYFFLNNAIAELRHINLFFYHIPSMSIGLPDVSSIRASEDTDPLEFFLTGNQDLSQSDSKRRNVSLNLMNPLDSSTLFIDFVFTDGDTTDWLLLSEVKLCTDISGESTFPTTVPSVVSSPPLVRTADEVTSNFTLSCTVQGEGRFRWEWTFPDDEDVTPSEVLLSDTTRTSTATFTRITSALNGNFRCTATFDPSLPNNIAMSGSQDIMVELKSGFERVGPSATSATLNETVELSCEMFGYFEETLPTVTWLFEGENIDSSNPLYEMTTRPGSRFIQNGGDSIMPSVINVLTITVNDSSVRGQYICSSTTLRFFTLSVTEEPSSTPSPTTSPSAFPTAPPPEPSNNFLASVYFIVIVVIVVLLILVILAVIVVICFFRKRNTGHIFQLRPTSRKNSLDYDGEPYYQELAKPAPPPLPNHFPELNDNIEAYATLDNHTMVTEMNELNGSIQHHQQPQQQQQQQQQAPMRLSTDAENISGGRLPFLEKNPLYASSDTLDKDRGAHSRRAGSVPSLDVLTDSPSGSQLNIYAQPSHVMPPPIPVRPPSNELFTESVYSEPSIELNTFRVHDRKPAMPSPPPDDSVFPCMSVYENPEPLLRSEGPKEIMPRNIQEVKTLGVGQFGQVVLADTVGLSMKDLRLSKEDDDKSVSVKVAVKRLKPDAERHVKEAFEKEIKFMSRLHSENVVRLLAICPSGNPFILMEYMENGDLNQFLQKQGGGGGVREETVTYANTSAPSPSPSLPGLSSAQLTYIALQIASGMKYLASFKFIHRDLATRNCLVGANLTVKIADFGMSRSLYSCDYYRISGRAMLPIRWMANECFYGKFSEKTDVWAFGVTMWEIFMFAKEQPYNDMTDQELIDDAIKGPERLLLSRPKACPPEVYEVMKRCWLDEPSERARFKDIHSLLEAIYEFGNLQ